MNRFTSNGISLAQNCQCFKGTRQDFKNTCNSLLSPRACNWTEFPGMLESNGPPKR